MSNETQVTDQDLQSVEHLKEAAARIKSELGKVPCEFAPCSVINMASTRYES